MAIQLLDQETQIRQSYPVANYNDTVAPSEANFETNPANLNDDLNNIRSMLSRLLDVQVGNWWDDINTPSALDTGSQRGVNDLNTDLHALERKRVLVDTFVHVDVTVSAAQNWEVLLLGELPTNTTAAVGAVTTAGIVAAQATSFGAHNLDEVSGATNVSPKNLCTIVDSVTHDPILSSGRTIYALFQTENGTDGHTMTGTTPNQAQLSFVRLNAAGTDLEAVPVADIENKIIHYSVRERKALEDITEQDFLKGAIVRPPTTTRAQPRSTSPRTAPLTSRALVWSGSSAMIWRRISSASSKEALAAPLSSSSVPMSTCSTTTRSSTTSRMERASTLARLAPRSTSVSPPTKSMRVACSRLPLAVPRTSTSLPPSSST